MKLVETELPHGDEEVAEVPRPPRPERRRVYVSLLLMATRISHPVLRTVVMVLCGLAPCLVGYARLYRGMHHPSDVAMGLVNGILSALLAWGYLRRDSRAARDRADEPSTGQTRA